MGLIPEGGDSSDLIHTKMDKRENMDLKLNITSSLFNAQSIKNMELLLYSHLIYHNIDLCILTETWLSKNISDTWLQCTVLNKDPYQKLTSNRTGSKAGV